MTTPQAATPSAALDPAMPSHSGDLALDIRRVSKTYGRSVHALQNVALSIRRGEVFGLLGPNGAGKSTLVKILMTVIRPSLCEGSLLGKPIGDKPTLARIGYLPEHHRFPEYLTAAQVVDFFGAMAGVDRSTRKARANQLLDFVGLANWKNSRVRTFSKGMRQRLGIAQALINDPDLVLLDEPTDGVDPVGRRDIREIVARERERGRTILLNSHLLSELEMICDRVAIMVQGTVRMEGTLADLTRDSRCYDIELDPERAGDASAALASLLAPPLASDTDALGTLHPDIAIRRIGGTIRIQSDDPSVVQPIIDALRAAGITIRAVRPIRDSLEDLFMKAVLDPTTGKPLAPGAQR